jgi:hypothetical protein
MVRPRGFDDRGRAALASGDFDMVTERFEAAQKAGNAFFSLAFNHPL